MFRHKGNRRTFSHNIRLASTLSFVAGLVNITGVLSVATLTTNVTGHFAYFAEAISLKKYYYAITYIGYILFFLLGAFTSNFLVELISRKKPSFSHTIPILVEIIILSIIGFSSNFDQEYIAFSLLFAMGLQNALVTNISQSIVRTTYLTGLFTDLGIEFSQLFFYKKEIEKKRLTRSIFLRLSIIIFFFFGCVIGGLLYDSLHLKVLFFAAMILLIAVFMDNSITYYLIIKRKIKFISSKSS
jgi:uncharacterized membrane protein YoaK (UPF0700 family)